MTDARHQAEAVTAVELGGATPILRVADLEASLAFYTAALGFEVQWRADGFAAVRRGGASLMLCQGDQGHAGTWVWIGVGDADALHDELLARGTPIRVPPTNYPWGSREVHVTDPDGHVLRFGSDLRPGEPMGAWVDAAGNLWLPREGGGWDAAQ
jgi:catechol 2,3-dioxygenase-like lactoylglutathione lyase family enzyme